MWAPSKSKGLRCSEVAQVTSNDRGPAPPVSLAMKPPWLISSACTLQPSASGAPTTNGPTRDRVAPTVGGGGGAARAANLAASRVL